MRLDQLLNYSVNTKETSEYIKNNKYYTFFIENRRIEKPEPTGLSFVSGTKKFNTRVAGDFKNTHVICTQDKHSSIT